MARDAQEFWDALHERWRIGDPDREARTVRSVLVHLRRRLPGPEARHLDEEIPQDLRTLWAEPEIERPGRKQPIEETDRGQFLAAVQDEAGLAEQADAEVATAAVFHALGRCLSDQERRHLAAQLPKGLKEIWTEQAGVPRHPAA